MRRTIVGVALVAATAGLVPAAQAAPSSATFNLYCSTGTYTVTTASLDGLASRTATGDHFVLKEVTGGLTNGGIDKNAVNEITCTWTSPYSGALREGRFILTPAR